MLLATQFCFADNPKQKTFTFGVSETSIKSVPNEQLELGFSYLMRNLTEKMGVNFKVIAFKNPDLMIKAIASGELDGVYSSSVDILKNEKLFNINKLLSAEINHKLKQRYVLLVRKDSNVQNIEQLKNVKFAYCIADSVGMLFLKTKLIEKKQEVPELFFSKMLGKKDANLAINSLFFRESSVALVMQSDFETASELNPQIKEQLAPLEASPDYLVTAIGLSNKLNSDEADKMISLASNIDKDPKTIQFLKLYGASNINQTDSDNLSSVRELISLDLKQESKSK
jgi:ABC-type phosphate/phosphonate transport system substrate-binding protein